MLQATYNYNDGARVFWWDRTLQYQAPRGGCGPGLRPGIRQKPGDHVTLPHGFTGFLIEPEPDRRIHKVRHLRPPRTETHGGHTDLKGIDPLNISTPG